MAKASGWGSEDRRFKSGRPDPSTIVKQFSSFYTEIAMKHEFILLTFAGVFFAGLLFLIVVIYKPIIFLGNQTSQPKAISTDSSMPTTQQDKID